ncbi:MAG: hypothetical protein AAF388_07945 [Bacteroidota bacterium]
MRKNPFIAIGYWTLFAVNLWMGCCFASFYPDQVPNSLLADVSQLSFALRMMEIIAYICKNWRSRKSGNSPKKRMRMKVIIISGTSYLMGLFLLFWAAPNMWAFVIGHLLLLIGGYHFGKQLAILGGMKKGGLPKDDQPSS